MLLYFLDGRDFNPSPSRELKGQTCCAPAGTNSLLAFPRIAHNVSSCLYRRKTGRGTERIRGFRKRLNMAILPNLYSHIFAFSFLICRHWSSYFLLDVFVSDSRDVLKRRLFGSRGTSETNAHEVRLSIKLPKHDMSVVIIGKSCCRGNHLFDSPPHLKLGGGPDGTSRAENYKQMQTK